MRKIFSKTAPALAVVFLISFLAVPVFAQAAEGPALDPTAIEAILVIFAGGIATLVTQGIKALFKLNGTAAKVLTGIVAIGVTAIYFLFIAPPLVLPTFALYAVVIFGEATGWYHLYKKKVT